MTMRRLVAALCCLMIALQPAMGGKLKGANTARRSLQNSVMVTRPPKDGSESMPKEAKASGPAPAPKSTSAPKASMTTAYNHNSNHHTWSSGEDHALPKSVHAAVSKSVHDEFENKMKMASGMKEADDHYDSPDHHRDSAATKSSTHKDSNNHNRPPSGGGSKGGDYKEDSVKSGGHSKMASGGYNNKGSGNKSGNYKSGGGGGGNKSGGSKGGGYKSGGNKSGGYKSGASGGGSYDGASYDMPEYRPPTGGTKGYSTKGYSTKEYSAKESGSAKSSGRGSTKDSGGSKYSSKSGGSKSASKSRPYRPPGITPEPNYERPVGEPLTGVPVTRFSMLYTLGRDTGMPMTSDYEEVHENTYLWLYTILFQTYGDRMKNLLTDDTSNIYQGNNQPIEIEYASVILFESDDPEIPTTAELDQIVVSAFTGANGEAYVEGIQSLDSSNPFSTITDATLETNPMGRTVGSALTSRVSTKNMLPTFMAFAGLCVFLAGGTAVYKQRMSSNQGGGGGIDKGFHAFAVDEATVPDDYTVAMSNLSEKSGRSRQTWDLALEVEPQENLSPITENCDLAGWSDYFDSSNGSKDSDRSAHEEHSQYSIEDFVNEAERNLLGVRIRYPGQSSTDEDTDDNLETGERTNKTETSTALVPAPPSAILPAPPSSLVAAAPNALVPHTTSG